MVLTPYFLSISRAVAERLHIDEVIAETLPEDKAAEIRTLVQQGKMVGVMGNIPEDQDLLAASRLSICINREVEHQLPEVDVLVLDHRLRNVAELVALGHRVLRTARENLFFSSFYHIFVPALAAGAMVPLGFLPMSPMAAIGMSSVALGLVHWNIRRTLYG